MILSATRGGATSRPLLLLLRRRRLCVPRASTWAAAWGQSSSSRPLSSSSPSSSPSVPDDRPDKGGNSSGQAQQPPKQQPGKKRRRRGRQPEFDGGPIREEAVAALPGVCDVGWAVCMVVAPFVWLFDLDGPNRSKGRACCNQPTTKPTLIGLIDSIHHHYTYTHRRVGRRPRRPPGQGRVPGVRARRGHNPAARRPAGRVQGMGRRGEARGDGVSRAGVEGSSIVYTHGVCVAFPFHCRPLIPSIHPNIPPNPTNNHQKTNQRKQATSPAPTASRGGRIWASSSPASRPWSAP